MPPLRSLMGKARRAEGARVDARKRSRPGEGRKRAGAGIMSGRVFDGDRGRSAAGGIPHFERLIQERTRELEEVNAALRASESTLRSF